MTDIMDKITKLLALADSPNENEAKLALLKARKLMADHKIREADITPTNRAKVVNQLTGITCSKRKNAWAVGLSVIIAQNYCCKSWRRREKGKQTVKIGIVGLEDDFNVCNAIFKYAYDYVSTRCDEIRKGYKGKYTPSYIVEITDAYGVGFYTGLQDAFRKQQEKCKEYALVLTTPKEVTEEISKLGGPSEFKEMKFDRNLKDYQTLGYKDGTEFNPSRKLE